MITKTLVEIMIIYMFQAQEFCSKLYVNQERCIVEIVDCAMSKPIEWCKKEYMNGYHGH